MDQQQPQVNNDSVILMMLIEERRRRGDADALIAQQRAEMEALYTFSETRYDEGMGDAAGLLESQAAECKKQDPAKSEVLLQAAQGLRHKPSPEDHPAPPQEPEEPKS